MKQLMTVRSNPYYSLLDDKLAANLEIILIHTDGKEYLVGENKQIDGTWKLAETRLIINQNNLNSLIDELKGLQKAMKTLSDNAKVLNTIIHEIKESEK